MATWIVMDWLPKEKTMSETTSGCELGASDVADRADALARKIMAGADTSLSWRDAGYETASDAALALVGDGGQDERVRQAAVRIVAAVLSEL